MNKLTQYQFAYFAAIVDGEGYIGKKYGEILINTTNRELALFLRRKIGGNLHRRKGVKKEGGGRYKDYYSWGIYKRELLKKEIIKNIFSYLIVKKERICQNYSPNDCATHLSKSVDTLWGNTEPSPLKDSYLAGIVDGEGCIHIRTLRNKEGRKLQFLPNINIGNTDIDLIEWIKSNYGGRIDFKKGTDKWKDRYYWNSNARPVKELCSKIYHYMIVKKPHIKQLNKFYKLPRTNTQTRWHEAIVSPNGKYLTTEGWERAHKIVRTISILNNKQSLLIKGKV